MVSAVQQHNRSYHHMTQHPFSYDAQGEDSEDLVAQGKDSGKKGIFQKTYDYGGLKVPHLPGAEEF